MIRSTGLLAVLHLFPQLITRTPALPLWIVTQQQLSHLCQLPLTLPAITDTALNLAPVPSGVPNLEMSGASLALPQTTGPHPELKLLSSADDGFYFH